MTKSRSRGWYKKHTSDTYVRQAQAQHYRARSAFKLQEIDEREQLFKPGQTVLDLGAAPGSWSQYAVRRIQPGGRLLAIDRLVMTPVAGADSIQGDLTDPAVREQCLGWLGTQRADLVISDVAPNLTGIAATDQANMRELADLLAEMAFLTLVPRGHFLIKLFQGEEVAGYVTGLREHFDKVLTRKPAASKDASKEIYVLGRSYRGYNV
ncbi:MAG: RlmE family RNA methyltransferase [Gammaproteobacteria bacterium]